MRCAADNFWAQPPLTLLLGAIVAFLGRQRHAADFLGPAARRRPKLAGRPPPTQ